MFTDRSSSNPVRPSELDWILGIAFRWGDAELSLYHEEDMPLDLPGLTDPDISIRFPLCS
jgi:hypothetical protein